MLPTAGDSIERVIAGWAVARPELDVAPVAVIGRVFRLAAELQPRLDAVLGRHGLRSADFAVLATLVRLGDAEVSQSALGRELGLTAGTISFRVDRLERAGLLARSPGADDRRQTLVALTREGRDAFEACVDDHLANCRDLLAGLEDEEGERLGRLLGKLLGSLEDAGPDDVLASQAGLVVAPAAEAVRRRREVGLPATPGLLVRHVDPDGPAAAAGLRAGDLLTAAGSRPLRTALDLRAVLAASGACELEVVRGVEALRRRIAQPAKEMT